MTAHFDRIEDLFEPLDGPDAPEPQTPQSLDEVVMVHGFDTVYRALQEIVEKENDR